VEVMSRKRGSHWHRPHDRITVHVIGSVDNNVRNATKVTGMLLNRHGENSNPCMAFVLLVIEKGDIAHRVGFVKIGVPVVYELEWKRR
jgi:hypothetical protein